MTTGPPDVTAPEGSEEPTVPPILPRLISHTLRLGALVSGALILIGLVLLISGSPAFFANATVQGAPVSLSGLATGLAHGQAVDILLLGFLVLIATPLARVILSAVMFASVRDRPFTVLTAGVLLLLGVSVLVGAFS